MSKPLTTDEVRAAYRDLMWEYTNTTTEAEEAAFDAWLTAVKAEAWDEGFDAGESDVWQHENSKAGWDGPCIKNPYLKDGDA